MSDDKLEEKLSVESGEEEDEDEQQIERTKLWLFIGRYTPLNQKFMYKCVDIDSLEQIILYVERLVSETNKSKGYGTPDKSPSFVSIGNKSEPNLAYIEVTQTYLECDMYQRTGAKSIIYVIDIK